MNLYYPYYYPLPGNYIRDIRDTLAVSYQVSPYPTPVPYPIVITVY